MRKFIYTIALAVAFLLTAISASAEGILIPVHMDSDPDHETPIPGKTTRMPEIPTTCTVDFSSLSIESSIADEIVSYELRSEDGKVSVLASASDSCLVEYMSAISGIYQFRVVTAGGISYTGYIEL